MAEVKKKRVVIASVLKPVDDTRMFGKFALSLLEVDALEVHVMGRSSKSFIDDKIQVHQLGFFGRISAGRFLAPWKVLFKIVALRPKLVIITTHELLFSSIIAKAFTGCKVIYDVQENYFLNIIHGRTFSVFIRNIVATYVRLKERLTSLFIDHFFLAEKAYLSELSFIGKKNTVLENKVVRPTNLHWRTKSKAGKKLLFSGTLAETTGVFTALKLARSLYEVDRNISLRIVGYCSQSSILERIKKEIAPLPFITLYGGDSLVPHEEILSEILKADAGIISYPPNASTYSAIPTKLYEYLGYQLPILLIDHAPWVALAEKYGAAIVFNPSDLHPDEILKSFNAKSFYDVKAGDEIYWESEADKLKREILSIIRSQD
jgi:hypothetical protein